MQRHRVVVIGAGFGGLFAIKALRNAPVDITLINGTAYHLFQPLLYQVATGILSEGEIAPPIREVLKRQRNVDVRLGWVTSVDVEKKILSVSGPGIDYEVGYDTLIVAAGAAQSYFGNDHFADHAPGMKNIDDALELRARIFGAFEIADLQTDPEAINRWLTFGDQPSTRALRQLHRLGVEVELNTKVVAVNSTGIEVESERGRQRIPSMTKVWAAGVAAPPLARRLAEVTGAKADRAGRIVRIDVLADPDRLRALDLGPAAG